MRQTRDHRTIKSKEDNTSLKLFSQESAPITTSHSLLATLLSSLLVLLLSMWLIVSLPIFAIPTPEKYNGWSSSLYLFWFHGQRKRHSDERPLILLQQLASYIKKCANFSWLAKGTRSSFMILHLQYVHCSAHITWTHGRTHAS
jgi:hypothetical protein